MNGVAKRSDYEQSVEDFVSAFDDERVRELYAVIAVGVKRNMRIFDELGETLFDMKLLTVDPAMRGRGIAHGLVSKSAELAALMGFKGAKIECTGWY